MKLKVIAPDHALISFGGQKPSEIEENHDIKVNAKNPQKIYI